MSLDAFLQQRLVERQQNYLYRQRKILDGAQSTHVRVGGKSCLAFSSNNYLGLANHPKVIEAFKRGADHYGIGSGASHLVLGHHRAHHQLEEELAAFTGRKRALLFSSGYMANLGVLSALVSTNDYVLEDKLNHASLIDAGLLSGARFQRYLHNDINSLEKYLIKANDGANVGHKLIATDGVFSMDGDVAPLPDLVQLAKKYDAWLMVDDAHGFGVLGPSGAGCAEHFALDSAQLPIMMGTLGKSLGTYGAFVAGSEALIDSLVQFSRTYIYTTALPPAIAEATRASLQLLKQEAWRRDQLRNNIKYFCQCANTLGLPLMASQTPIQPFLIGDNGAVIRIARQLEEKDLIVSAIRPPTVPEKTARLRITLSAEHTHEEIDRLLSVLNDAWRDVMYA